LVLVRTVNTLTRTVLLAAVLLPLEVPSPLEKAMEASTSDSSDCEVIEVAPPGRKAAKPAPCGTAPSQSSPPPTPGSESSDDDFLSRPMFNRKAASSTITPHASAKGPAALPASTSDAPLKGGRTLASANATAAAADTAADAAAAITAAAAARGA
ncbi:unnamed protein product, partial [Phaeothamnion confervicola]